MKILRGIVLDNVRNFKVSSMDQIIEVASINKLLYKFEYYYRNTELSISNLEVYLVCVQCHGKCTNKIKNYCEI